MKFQTHSHRFGLAIAQEEEFIAEWNELQNVLSSISDEDIMQAHSDFTANNKSISRAINRLIKDKFEQKNWISESAIFNDPNYQQTKWRLDFAKNLFSVEVAFNHGEATAWNLLKPVLASELNHVSKDAQTQIGVVIMANQDMKEAGGFDSAVGTYEKAIRYLAPLQNQLTVPMILIGLKAPETFKVVHTGKPKRALFERL
ncbi:hypothetical protein OAV04_02050 [Candidatus Poseidoniaceae archaeon]|nr:hypothetical protein [Candidatus Poseidoniaceae archaeon]